MKPLDRDSLLATLRGALGAHPEVDAAWEGGSAAFSYRDELSDVDAVVVVADDAVEAVFAAVEAALNALSPIALRHDVTGTPGFTQRFYRLRDASEFLVVDLVLIRRSDPLLFRDVELHGQGQTWVDRNGLLQPPHLDAAADLEQARARIPALRSAFDMFQHIPTKERARDLPSEVVARIEQLMFVADLPYLERKHEQAQQWFWETMARLERDGPGAADDGSARN